MIRTNGWTDGVLSTAAGPHALQGPAPPPGHGILRRLFGCTADPEDGKSFEARTIAVASGKGGTGKSFLATNLAVALSDRAHRATLVDCDFGLGNAHLLLGVNPHLTVQHVLNGQATLEEITLRTRFGPNLVPGGSGISRLADLTEDELVVLARGLGSLASVQDVLLLDTAGGISPQAIMTLLVVDQVVLVTNPEIAALTDAYGLVKCLARQPDRPPVSVVVNRVMEPGLGRATHEKLADVARRFTGYELHYLGEIPEEPAVTQRRLGQAPLVASHPDCEAACCINEILDALQERMGDLRPHLVPPQDLLGPRFRRRLLHRR